MVMEAPRRVRLGEKQLMAHLLRRAGFGATLDELQAALARGYEAVVDDILHPERTPDLDEHLMFRYYPDFRESRQIFSTATCLSRIGRTTGCRCSRRMARSSSGSVAMPP